MDLQQLISSGIVKIGGLGGETKKGILKKCSNNKLMIL